MKILFFNGPPHSGKDTIAAAVRSMIRRRGFHCRTDKLAQPIRDWICSVTGEADAWVEANKATYPSALRGMGVREAMIHYSENIMKPLFGKDIFSSMLENRLEGAVADYGLVTDGGFQSEIDYFLVRDWDVDVIQLRRNGTTFEGDSREWVYASRERTFVIDNNLPVDQVAESIFNRIIL